MTGALAMAVSLGVAAATGWFVVSAVAGPLRRSTLPLAACLAICIGVSLHSVAYLGSVLLLRAVPTGWLVVDGVALAAAGWFWRRRRRRGLPAVPGAAPRRRRVAAWVAVAAFVAGLALATVGVAELTRRRPLGEWDAWAMWNYKAAMLYHAPPHVAAVFADFPHPDYPLAVPATVARAWRYAGGIDTLAPRGFAVLSGVLALGAVAAGLAALRGPVVGAVGGLVAASSWFMVQHASMQYAEPWLSAACALALACAAMWVERRGRAWLLLTGLAASAAAWTKNEGLLFAGLLTAALLVDLASRRPRRLNDAARLAAGLAVFGLPIAAVKLGLASAGTDLFRQLDAGTLLARAADGARQAQVVTGWRGVMAAVVEPVTAGLWLAAAALGAAAAGRVSRAAWLAAGVVAAQMAGYAAVYLLLSEDLAWHLQTSADRVVVGVWPAMVLAAGLLFPRPGDGAGPRAGERLHDGETARA